MLAQKIFACRHENTRNYLHLCEKHPFWSVDTSMKVIENRLVLSTEVQQKFISLRAQGNSFARIAQELNVSKQTLVNWSRKFQFEIQNLRAIEMEALQHQLIESHETRARTLGEQLRRVEAELAQRDLANVSTGRLYSLADSLRRQIIRETGQVQFTSPVKEIPSEEYYDEVQDWTA